MRHLVTDRELDALGEGVIRDYLRRNRGRHPLSIDIEGFITEYLGLELFYEQFAEPDPGKIGYISDGKSPLFVYRGGQIRRIVFPEGAVVVEKYLLRSEESGRRRFTLAHEAAHRILEKHIPLQSAGYFHNDFDREQIYSFQELHELFCLNEVWANRLGAALLMPEFLLERAVKRFHGGAPVRCYGDGIFSQEDKLSLQKIADAMGVSYTALVNRFRELELLEYRPLEEYIEGDLGIRKGGA